LISFKLQSIKLNTETALATRGSAIAEKLHDALYQLKSCHTTAQVYDKVHLKRLAFGE